MLMVIVGAFEGPCEFACLGRQLHRPNVRSGKLIREHLFQVVLRPDRGCRVQTQRRALALSASSIRWRLASAASISGCSRTVSTNGRICSEPSAISSPLPTAMRPVACRTGSRAHDASRSSWSACARSHTDPMQSPAASIRTAIKRRSAARCAPRGWQRRQRTTNFSATGKPHLRMCGEHIPMPPSKRWNR